MNHLIFIYYINNGKFEIVYFLIIINIHRVYEIITIVLIKKR